MSKPILPNISTRPAQYAYLLLDAADGDVSRALNLLTDEALRFGLSSYFMSMTTQSITRQAANACEPGVDMFGDSPSKLVE